MPMQKNAASATRKVTRTRRPGCGVSAGSAFACSGAWIMVSATGHRVPTAVDRAGTVRPSRRAESPDQPGQPPVGQRLAAGLAAGAVLEAGVGEGHLADGAAADRAGQPGAGVYRQSG